MVKQKLDPLNDLMSVRRHLGGGVRIPLNDESLFD
jgi:hypothetical protein